MTAPGPIPAPRRRRPRGRFALVAFAVTLLSGSVLTVGTAAAYEQAYAGRIVEGVTVAGVDVGGRSPAAAREAILAVLPDPGAGALTLRAGSRSLVIPYAWIERRYDLDATIEAAMSVGRRGGTLDRPAEQLRSLVRGTDFPVAVTYDAAALDAQLASLVAAVERPARDATVRLRQGAWRVTPSEPSVDLDEAAFRAAAHAAVAGLGTGTADTEVSLDPTVTPAAVATEAAEAAAARANAMAGAGITLVDGERVFEVELDVVRAWVQVGPEGDEPFAVSIDRSAIEATLAERLEGIGLRAVDAGFAFGEGTTVVAVPGQTGLALDLEATVSSVLGALETRGDGAVATRIPVATEVIEPRFTLAQAQAAVPRVRQVSHWVTRFEPGLSNYQGRNISIPASRIHGQSVGPGRWFDFWKAIGEVSRAAGYGPGGAIVNGRTEPTGALAGGICSCSTTIFNAALRAGLEMGQRKNHYYYINRYPVGLDATVWKSSSGATQSMRFRNDTEYPVLIRAINRYGVVRFEIWTVPTGRTVQFSEPVIRDRGQARDTIEYTDEIAVGRRERVEYPADGFRVWVTRIVRDASGAIIHEDTFASRYATVDGVTLIGVRSDDPRNGRIVVVG